MDGPKLGILILNYNGEKWLQPLYASLQRCGYEQCSVYLIDNASQDRSINLTLKDFPHVKIVRMPENLGYCMAYNLAVPRALTDGCDWVVLCNTDLLFEPGCLSELVDAARRDPKIGVLGPAFLNWDADGPNPYMTGNHPQALEAMQKGSKIPIDVNWVEGSLLMASRDCLRQVGPLDPVLHSYWEDADFCRRARYRGYRVVLVPSALARHYGAGTWSSVTRERRRLMSHNLYLYKLTDPGQSFPQNFAAAGHLFAVSLKQAVQAGSGVAAETILFARVLRHLKRFHSKWLADRDGRFPPATTPEFAHVVPEIVSDENRAQPLLMRADKTVGVLIANCN